MFGDGAIDWSSYRRLIDWHVQEGSDALVVVGTSGESATLSMAEHLQLIGVAVEHAADRIPIIAGTGANSTQEAIELTCFAAAVGAHAALSVVPYYNKPTQNGLYRHFSAIAQAADIPLILYNVPGRTITDLANDTVLELAAVPNIAGLKDATGDIGRAVMLMRSLPQGFALYSGDDPTAAALMLLGAQGNISVTANVVPALMAQLCAAARTGDVATVRALGTRLAPLHEAMFKEANPIPVKWAVERLLSIPAHYRLPLTPASNALRYEIANAIFGALALDQPDTVGAGWPPLNMANIQAGE